MSATRYELSPAVRELQALWREKRYLLGDALVGECSRLCAAGGAFSQRNAPVTSGADDVTGIIELSRLGECLRTALTALDGDRQKIRVLLHSCAPSVNTESLVKLSHARFVVGDLTQ